MYTMSQDWWSGGVPSPGHWVQQNSQLSPPQTVTSWAGFSDVQRWHNKVNGTIFFWPEQTPNTDENSGMELHFEKPLLHGPPMSQAIPGPLLCGPTVRGHRLIAVIGANCCPIWGVGLWCLLHLWHRIPPDFESIQWVPTTNYIACQGLAQPTAMGAVSGPSDDQWALVAIWCWDGHWSVALWVSVQFPNVQGCACAR